MELNPIEMGILEGQIQEAIRTVYDPEIPVNIYELGLIYGVEVESDGSAHVQMTLTTPHCPAAQSLPGEVEMKVREVEGITDAEIEIVWDPPWTLDRMSDEAKLELGLL